MSGWFSYLKKGLKRPDSPDRLSARRAAARFDRLWPFFIRHWPKALLGAVLVFAASASGYIQPLVQRFLIDRVILGRQLGLLPWTILVFIVLYLLGQLGGMLQHFYFTHFGQSVMLDIQNDLLRRVFQFPKVFFDEQDTGYLISRLNGDIKELQWFFSGTLVYLVSSGLSFLVGLGLLVYLQWSLALGILIVLPALAVCVRFFSRRIKVLSRHNLERQAGVLKRLQESLASIPLLKAFVSEQREADAITREIENNYRLSLEQSAVQSLAQVSISALGDLARLLALLFGVPLVVGGGWTAGSLFAFYAYLAYVINPVKYFATVGFQFQRAQAALERISAFYEILPEEHGSGIAVEKLTGAIEFRGVSFAYAGQEPVLRDLSFKLAPGEHAAVIGPSGVGKTTLISLLLDFYRPTGGTIFFDGRPAADYAVDSLRRRLGYVAQGTRLLSGTIRENLLYGDPEAGAAEMEQAAKLSGIHDFIAGLPQGYDSRLGENGVNLSEGQRQRLAIARALVKDPDILILDEPSSALDAETERSIFELLPKAVRHKTMIIVTHRPATLKAVDRIIDLNAG